MHNLSYLADISFAVCVIIFGKLCRTRSISSPGQGRILLRG